MTKTSKTKTTRTRKARKPRTVVAELVPETALAVTVSETAALVALDRETLEAAEGYARAALAPATRAAYRRAWEGSPERTTDRRGARDGERRGGFCAWCAEKGLAPIPAGESTVAAYLAFRAKVEERKPATVALDLAAVTHYNREAGHEVSKSKGTAVEKIMSGIARTKGVAQTRKAAAEVEIVADMLGALQGSDETKILRDHALLLVGFLGGFRRSELADMRREDIDLSHASGNVLVLVRKSKTDQRGAGRTVKLIREPDPSKERFCPVRALRAWLGYLEGDPGPKVFRSVSRFGTVGADLSPRSVGEIVKGYAEAVGLDPKAYAGHSLRAGFVTTALRAGRSPQSVAAVTGHKGTAMLDTYYRPETFEDVASAGLF